MKNPFFTPKSVEATVGDEPHKFYPARVYVLGQLKGFLKPLFQALSSLSNTFVNDTAKETVETKGEGGEYQLRTSVAAIDAKLAAQRASDRERLINGLVEELTSPPAQRALAMLIMDSMRDDFSVVDDKTARDFVQNVDLATMAQMLKGVALANKEVFGPLTERASSAIDALKSRIQVQPRPGGSEDDPEQPSEQPEPQPSKEILTSASGSTSSAPSSPV